MKHLPPKYIFVDSLNHFNWLFYIMPRIRKELTQGSCCHVLYVDGQESVVRLAKRTLLTGENSINKMDFLTEDITDKKGLVSWISIRNDLDKLRDAIIRSKTFREAADFLENKNLELFFHKSIVTNSKMNEQPGFWRTAFIYHVCACHMRSIGREGEKAVLFTSRTQWWKELSDHGYQMGFDTIPYYGPGNTAFLAKQLGILTYYVKTRRIGGLLLEAARKKTRKDVLPSLFCEESPSAQLAVHNYGQFNLDRPEEASSQFFLRQSGIRPENTTIVFEGQQDPLTRERAELLSEMGMRALAMDKTTAPNVPEAWMIKATEVSHDRFRKSRKLGKKLRGCGNFRDKDWLQAQHFMFNERVNAWVDAILENNIKLYTSWYVYNDSNAVIAEAMRQTGGIMTVYQRSYEPTISLLQAASADVYFSFSNEFGQLKTDYASLTPYVVTTGYLGDFRFPLLKKRAAKVRGDLKSNGAQIIISYLDENSRPDGRFLPGHETIQNEYRMLLERLITDKSLGLILKPKVSTTLRERLGPVCPLLDQAIATGRCYIHEEKNDYSDLRHRFTPSLPAEAALASDVVIHGHLHSATAGVETALTGTPTVMLDRENYNLSPLHELGEGKVVFKDWTSLWGALKEDRSRPNGIPGLGDWTPILDRLDPFRDGKAALRMGTYLKWLVEGFDAGLDKETILADATERYRAAWGDKAIQTTYDARVGQ